MVAAMAYRFRKPTVTSFLSISTLIFLFFLEKTIIYFRGKTGYYTNIQLFLGKNILFFVKGEKRSMGVVLHMASKGMSTPYSFRWVEEKN